MQVSRRRFLEGGVAAVAAAACRAGFGRDEGGKRPPLTGEVGVTISSLGNQLSGRAKGRSFTLLELPPIMRDELDMRVIDLNTTYFESFEPAYLEKLRSAAADAGCLLTNLKMNQRNVNLGSPKKDERERALAVYQKSIDAASALGLRWARPLPKREKPDLEILAEGYRRLADYADKRGVGLLVENFGWMDSDPQAAIKFAASVGPNVDVCPDTGNWSGDEVRYAGLATMFPRAVTCDFKARELGSDYEHKKYDLKRCFTVGWEAGFRGPWCLEHAHRDTGVLFRELGWLRDRLCAWMKESA